MRKILAAHDKLGAVLLGWDEGDLLQSKRKVFVIVLEDELMLIDQETNESIDIPWDLLLNVTPVGDELVIDLKTGTYFTVRSMGPMSVGPLIVDRVFPSDPGPATNAS